MNNVKTIYDVLNGNCNFEESIKDTKINNLKIVSSNVDLSGLEVETASLKIEELFYLKDKIEDFINSEKNNFSYIFIDCPPSLSLLNSNGTCCCKIVNSSLASRIFCTRRFKSINENNR